MTLVSSTTLSVSDCSNPGKFVGGFSGGLSCVSQGTYWSHSASSLGKSYLLLSTPSERTLTLKSCPSPPPAAGSHSPCHSKIYVWACVSMRSLCYLDLCVYYLALQPQVIHQSFLRGPEGVSLQETLNTGQQAGSHVHCHWLKARKHCRQAPARRVLVQESKDSYTYLLPV